MRAKGSLSFSGFLLMMLFLGCGRSEAPDQEPCDRPPSPQELLKQAVKSHGGREALDNWRCAQVTTLMTGNVAFAGANVQYQMTRVYRWPAQVKDINSGFPIGKSFCDVVIWNGNRNWAMTTAKKGVVEDTLDNPIRETYHLSTLLQLLQVLDSGADVSLAKNCDESYDVLRIEVGGRWCADVYLGKTNRLVAKIVRPGMDLRGSKIRVELTYSDYREFDGLMVPQSITAKPEWAAASCVTLQSLVRLEDVPATVFTDPRETGLEFSEVAKPLREDGR